MKRILCFGDSNTWGYRPDGQGRFDVPKTWPGVMASALEGQAVVDIDGLCGRTTTIPDPVEGEHLNGATYLLPCLLAHSPLDLVIIKLGCNDQKQRFNMKGIDIAQSISRLVKIVQNSGVNGGKSPEILVIQPAPIKLRSFAETFDGAPERAVGMTEAFKRETEALGVHLLNEGEYVESSEVDGIHLELDAHALLGEIVTERVKQILNLA
jgi:lysophospholipase L1-like esterase